LAETLITAAERSVVEDRTSNEHAAVQQILSSKQFAKAPLLSAFLSYVSQRALEQEMVRISEYEIGTNVFQRSASFDPREDNIVRTYARHLRKRLLQYYETDGANDTVRVDIPKGTYVPVFRTWDPPDEAEPPIDQPAPEERSPDPPPRFALRTRHRMLGLAAFLLTAYSIVLFWVGRSTVHPHITAEQQSPLHPLWKQLFRQDQDTFVVPADIGFVILQQANHRTFSLAEYLSWFSSQGPDAHMSMSYLKDQTYTSVLNLNIVSSLQRLPEANSNRFIIRAAKNVRIDDLRDGNAILLGSNYSNPWDEIFSDKLNFHFVNRPDEDRSWIDNQHPDKEEATTYESATNNATHRTYAVLAFVQNLDKNGHVLLLQGLDAAGTQAAADMLFNNDDMQSVIRKAMNPDGTMENFELLIEAKSLDANSHATGSRIVSSRFYN
jgi:hypothetical protein